MGGRAHIRTRRTGLTKGNYLNREGVSRTMDDGKLRRLRRVLPFVTVLTLLMVSAAVAFGQLDPSDDDPPVVALEDARDPGPDACTDLMKSFMDGAEPTSNVGLGVGLTTNRIPGDLAARGIRNFSCLADNLAQRVEMVLISIGESSEEGVIVIPHIKTSSAEVTQYMAEAYPQLSAVLDSDELRGLSLYTTADSANSFQSELSSDSVELWPKVIAQRDAAAR